jgi:citrate synthase
MLGSGAFPATMTSNDSAAQTADSRVGTLTAVDSRTGRSYEFPISEDTIPAIKLRGIKVHEEDFGMLSFDPALLNTAVCHSAITFIDGDKGILDYRGYSIEEMSSLSSFEETCYLLLDGELPTASELDLFKAELHAALDLPESMVTLHGAMRRDLHPMSMLESALAALGGDFPESDEVLDAEVRRQQIARLLALTPVLAALGHRHREGKEPVAPDASLSYAGNFLHMMLGEPGKPADVHPALERAMDALLILHADHEQNCSANAVRAVASSRVNPYSAVAAGASALHGPLHGGANQAVLEMLDTIDSVDDVPAFLESCKSGEKRLMGFGHRVYKNYDPRAKVIGQLAEDVFEVVGADPKLEIARALEREAMADDYFISRKLFPNVDFYSGLIYAAMGFPPRMFTVFFAVGRMVGWLAHWDEMMRDPNTRIVRPRQIYTGPSRRPFVAIGNR